MKTLQTILVISIFSFVSVQISGQVESNREKLLQFSATKTAEFTQKKAEAEEYARLNNLPMIIETDTSYIELMFIDDFGMPQYYVTSNKNAAKTISTNKVHPGGSAGLNLDGTGLTVHEWDAGAVLNTHQEFGSRVTQGDGATITHYHSTHVAGTMIASGVDPDAKGMATNASLRAFEWNNDLAEMASEGASGALVSNHSYGFVRGWHGGYWYGNPSISTQEDYRFGFYDGYAQGWDQVAHDAPYYLIVKSGGNDRNDCGDGTYPCDGPYDCISQTGISKNILTVGAIEDIPGEYSSPSDVVMSSFSSWGPADDGRIKPDITANGISLYSTDDDSNDDYRSLSGTSMASPSVAGSLILLQQHYENLNGSGNLMKAATLKALVIHTADEAGTYPGPDYEYGWGLMNTKNAAELISNENGNDTIIAELTLTYGATYQYSFTNTGTEPLQVTIAWTDPPGTPPAPALDPVNPMLVNDLDLKVTESANIFYPWKLDRDNPSDMATNTTENDVDNVEVVFIEHTIFNAIYTVTVSHDGILQGGSQDFSIILSPVTKPYMQSPSPAIDWANSFGGSDQDWAYSMENSFDGGYIIAGYTQSNDGDVTGNHGGQDYWVIKLDRNGNKIWSKCFGGSGLDAAKSICKTYDSCFLIVGYSNSNDGDVIGNHGGQDLWILKIDRNGNKIWSKCFGGSNGDYGQSIHQTNDSCYVLCGLSSSSNGDLNKNNGSTDYWLLKLDRYGDKIWSKSFGGSNYENAQSIVQTMDSGYIMAGWSESNDGDVSGNHGQSDYWVIKTDKNGNKEWSKCFGGSSLDNAYSLCHSFDSGYIVAGRTISHDGDVTGTHGAGEDILIININNSGDTVWTRTFGGKFGESAWSILQTSDSNYIAVGSAESNDGDVLNNYGGDDYWAVKINRSGNIIWSKNMGGSSGEVARSIQLSIDNGYVLAGFSGSNDVDVSGNHGLYDFWILKLSKNFFNLPGSFTDSNQELGTSSSTDVALGDLDGDGDLDAAITNDEAGQPNKVWLNDGNGNFTDSGLSFGNAISWGIALGDLDGDGDLDGFIANDGPNKVYLNNGTNTTHNGQNLGNSASHDVKLADLDGDGDLDAAVANNASGQPNKIWLNNGNGTFTAFAMDFGNAISWGLALGDLDGDGDIDGFIANDGPNKVYLNAGSYTTDNGQNLGNASGKGIRLGDMDGDGDLDAVVANDASGQPNKVWLNDGDGDFTDSGLSFGDNLSMGLALGDLDGDGDLDGFVANNGANMVYLNDGVNTADNGQYLGSSNSYAAALGDLDGDGDLDAFVANYDGPNKVWLNQTIEYHVNAQSVDENVVADKNAVDIENTSTLAGFESYEKDNASSDVLLENYPDPFTNRTTIRFKVNKTGEIVLNILNQFGKVTDILFDATATAGQEYKIVFHGDHLPAGIYVILLQGENGLYAQEKMVLVK